MPSLIKVIGRTYYTTPLIYDKFRYLIQNDNKVEEKKKIPYSKPSYENMYTCLPLKNFDNHYLVKF